MKKRISCKRLGLHVGDSFLYLNRRLLREAGVEDGAMGNIYIHESGDAIVLDFTEEKPEMMYAIWQGRYGNRDICDDVKKILGEQVPRVTIESKGVIIAWRRKTM